MFHRFVHVHWSSKEESHFGNVALLRVFHSGFGSSSTKNAFSTNRGFMCVSEPELSFLHVNRRPMRPSATKTCAPTTFLCLCVSAKRQDGPTQHSSGNIPRLFRFWTLDDWRSPYVFSRWRKGPEYDNMPNCVALPASLRFLASPALAIFFGTTPCLVLMWSVRADFPPSQLQPATLHLDTLPVVRFGPGRDDEGLESMKDTRLRFFFRWTPL